MLRTTDHLTVAEVASRSGFAASALRFYEREGLIHATRTTGNQRRYERNVLRRLAFIRAARNVGLSLEEVAAALATLPESRTPTKADWTRLSRGWRARLDAQIAALEKLRDGLDSCIGCGCLSLKRCAISNPADTARAEGPGASFLPAPLRLFVSGCRQAGGIMGFMRLDVPMGRKVRRAEVADAADLVRLRAQMLADMGRPVGDDADPWRASAASWFAGRLAGDLDFAAFVVEDPDDGVVACSAGICDFHAPGPGNLTGVRGHVFNMSTFPAHRRRGYARACLEALLDWFRDSTQARVINLNATPDGAALYRSLGFAEPHHAALQVTLVPPAVLGG